MVIREKREYLKPKGLQNIGNTCFFNGSIQCLLSMHEFTSYFKNNTFDSSMPISLAFSEFLKDYENSTDVLSPRIFIQKIKDRVSLFNGRQQDSHEFVIKFLEALHDEQPIKKTSFTSKVDFVNYTSQNIISHLFYSYNVQTVVCSKCKFKSETYVVMNMLPIEVSRSTQAGLDKVYEEEEISGSSAWKCDSCGSKTSSIKKLEVSVLPKILILYIKRFKSLGYKNNGRITIDDKIVWGGSSYYCTGVVCHSGSLNDGHYYSEARRMRIWTHYNDRSISNDFGNYDPSTPYLVFFSKNI